MAMLSIFDYKLPPVRIFVHSLFLIMYFTSQFDGSFWDYTGMIILHILCICNFFNLVHYYEWRELASYLLWHETFRIYEFVDFPIDNSINLNDVLLFVLQHLAILFVFPSQKISSEQNWEQHFYNNFSRKCALTLNKVVYKEWFFPNPLMLNFPLWEFIYIFIIQLGFKPLQLRPVYHGKYFFMRDCAFCLIPLLTMIQIFFDTKDLFHNKV